MFAKVSAPFPSTKAVALLQHEEGLIERRQRAWLSIRGSPIACIARRRPIAHHAPRHRFSELRISVAPSGAQPQESSLASTSKSMEDMVTITEVAERENSPPNRNQRSARLTNFLQLRRLYREIIRVNSCIVQSEELMKAGHRKSKVMDQMSEDERERRELGIVKMKLNLIEEFDRLEKSIVLDQNSIECFLNDIFCEENAKVCQNANDVRSSIRVANKELIRSAAKLRRSVTAEQLYALKKLQEEELSEKLRKSIPQLKKVVGRLEDRLESVQWGELGENINWQGLRQWTSALWLRLNGKGNPGESLELRQTQARMNILLPMPPSEAKAIDDNVVTLFRVVDDLERRLRDKMRERDRLLRNTRDRLSRARLGSNIRLLDDHVSELRRELAVRQLELEMERIHMALENEFREFSESTGRSDQEGELLLAEFAVIDSKLGELVSAVMQGDAEAILDQDLYTLASEIPDLSSRLGVEDQGPQVAAEDSVRRFRIAAEDLALKLKNGLTFFGLGSRIFAQDLFYSTQLFWRAVLGSNLRPREAQTIRRTLRDLFTLQYFPGFFPSAFDKRRQLLMRRYEYMRTQLIREAEELGDAKARLEAQGRIDQALRAVVLGDERVLQNLFKKYVGEEFESVDESGENMETSY